MDLKINKNTLAFIVAAISDKEIKLLKEEELKYIDVIELRVDTFEDFSSSYVDKVFKLIKMRFKKPLIGTIRLFSEGGQTRLSEDERIKLFKTIIPIADLIDIEINSKIYKSIVQTSHLSKKTVIASYHNLKKTPSDTELSRLLLKAKSAKPEIVKFATKARTLEDVGRLLCFSLKHINEHLVTISLGQKGTVSRVINPLFGSILTYGYIGKPKADGQMHVKQLANLLDMLNNVKADN